MFIGPFPLDDREGQPEKDPHLRSRIRSRLRRTILTDLARRAYRRPATQREVDALAALRGSGEDERPVRRTGHCSSRSRRCWCRRNFLFRIERDPDPRDPALVHEVSPFELASRLSYFLWSSMPDDELLTLAEAGKLRDPRVLDAQVKRMLADPRAVCVCRELRRPVAGNAQPRYREAGSGQVPGVGPGAARGDEDRDDDVLRARAAREPSGQRFPERKLHVPERAARGALRHRRRHGPRVPQGRR